ncbi:hypothetical protein M514_07931 [Trichuris suis]|uniref:Mos1 transposase HTH domain-containing protein n=1 Tax=Trichuris suis TaxID=68888 RepID=A0A085NIZ3_9BILA|nr:hypothetical protein M514_07931 [Trichuris suis]
MVQCLTGRQPTGQNMFNLISVIFGLVRRGSFIRRCAIVVRANIKFLSKLGWQPRRIIQSLQQVYGSSAPSKSVVYGWIRRFKDGREAIEDDQRAGRPATATSEGTVARVRNLVEGDRRITIRRIATMAGISLHSAFGILHETLGLRKLSARWVPKALREEQLIRRVNLSRELLTKIEANETGFLTVSSQEMKRRSTNMTPRVRSNPSSGYRRGQQDQSSSKRSGRLERLWRPYSGTRTE